MRGELENTTDQLTKNLKFLKASEPLDHILSLKRSPLIKTSLSYQEDHDTSKDEAPSRTTYGELPKNNFIRSNKITIEDINQVKGQPKHAHFSGDTQKGIRDQQVTTSSRKGIN